MIKTRKQRLEDLFYAHATPAERLSYDLKRERQKVSELESLPAKVVEVEKEVVKEVKIENPVTGEEVVNKVNSLKIEPEYQIDFAHIKNFPWHLVKQAGESMGLISWGGGRVLEVTGTIDDSNTSFVIGSKPMVVVINGGMYQSTGGAITWTYSEGTLTTSFPVGSSGSIFGLS